MSEKQAKARENLKGYRKVVQFIKTLDDEGVEEFIKVVKKEGSLIESEDELRKTLRKIRGDKRWD